MITPEQNKTITTYLQSKNLPIDLVLEIKDHMIEQIENKENLTFEEAFEKVKESWKEEITPYWKGDWDLENRNRLVRNLEKNIFKEINKQFLPYLFLLIFLFFSLSYIVNIEIFKIIFIIISSIILFFPLLNLIIKYRDLQLWRKYQNYILTLYQQYTFLNLSAAYFVFRLIFDGENVAQYLFDFFHNPNFKNLLLGFLISFILYYVSFITYHSQKIYLSKIQKVKPFLKYL